MEAQNKHTRGWAVARVIISLAILAAAAWVFINRQPILDHVLAWSYRPSPEMAQIVKADTMTDEAKLYFYASHPAIENRGQFNTDCQAVQTEQAAVLGCYTGQRIFIFNVDSKKLDGIKQVTAAHEMLHAAYDRLSGSERTKVDKLIGEEAKQNTNPDIKELVKLYEKSEPGEKLNELHSIFGTQVADLSPALENYYKQYFNDRSKVVKMYDDYHSVFLKLKSKQDRLVAELNTLAGQIKQLEAAYASAVADYNRDVESFNTRASSGRMSRSEYKSEKAALKSRQARLNQQKSNINQKIDLYNQKRQELLAINSQAAALNHSIDSSLPPLKGVD